MTASPPPSMPNGQAFRSTRPGRLDDVFGIRVGAYEEPALLNEVAKGNSSNGEVEVAFEDRTATAQVPRFDLVEPRGADVIASLTGLDRPYPAVTAHRYGAGKAIYIGMSARRSVLNAVLDTEIERLGVRTGPPTPEGVMARAVTDRHLLYLNLDGTAKRIELPRPATGVLSERRYEEAFDLGPWDVELVELV